MTRIVSVAEVRAALIDGREIALLDVREEGPYSRGHPLFAVSLPLGRIELKVLDLVPRQDAPVVLYDDGGGLVERAEALSPRSAIPISPVSRAASKAGEPPAAKSSSTSTCRARRSASWWNSSVTLPRCRPVELDRLIADKADVVVLDSRRFEEYRTMSIPTGTSVPGGELVLRLHDLAPRPETTVIVNCAGRTRSIIGTQSLINAGIPNPVFALRNGTIGWTLAGLQLDRGAGRRFPQLSEEARAAALKRAQALAERVGVRTIDRQTVERWRQGRGVHAVPARRAQFRGIRGRPSPRFPLGAGRTIGTGDRRMGRRAPRPPRAGRR